MPGTKPRRNYPINGLTNGQVNGFYVHSSPPKVLQATPKTVRQCLRSGDLNQLEQIVLNGQGQKLIGEYSPDPKIRAFLKQVPLYMGKIKELHNAVTKGNLKQLQKLLDSKTSDTLSKNLFSSKNNAGVGLLHKAAYYGYPDIVQFLVSNFPQCVNMKDKEGKTPLHYCGASQKSGKIWSMLIKAGADAKTPDSKNRLPLYYMERSNEIHLIEDKVSPEVIANATPDLVIKPSNIRIWIHDRDLDKLRRVIWEGHGGKLRVETSNHPRVRRFLEGVPYILNMIKDAHASVVNGEHEEFVKKTSEPVPVEVLGSKDANGLNPLHKAAGLGHLKIVRYILEKTPNLISSVDQGGKTALHYAAGLKDDNVMFNFLVENNADEMAFDKSGKLPSYYKSNPKELNSKLLEVVPEAPRTSQALSQTVDWTLFHPGGSTASTVVSVTRRNPPAEEKTNGSKETNGNISSEEYATPEKTVERENGEISKPDSEDVEVQNPKMVEPVEDLTESEDNQEEKEEAGYDIWTNDSAQEEKMTEDENTNGPEEQTESEIDEREIKNENAAEKQEEYEIVDRRKVEMVANTPVESRQKTEREIAEERQRLLDEGLTTVAADDDDVTVTSKTVEKIIESGDMEKLASMVLNGEGDKLSGKTSDNPEVQTFLDNLPSYMAKITAVHKAAKSGSLKDLQGSLDRRRFAIAKESSDKLGATPLHVAILYGNSQIAKYLGGRFPETLKATDKFGRTPLHYAAILKDGDYFFNTLINFGAEQHVLDDAGHTADYYRENDGELTKETLLQELDGKGVSSPLTDPSVHEVEPEISFDEGIPLSKTKDNEDVEDDAADSANFAVTDRDEYGQSILHFAAARAHGRGGLFQLIHESSVNLGYRDELYRTARDVALQANIPENINEIDKYVISLVARDETEKLMQLYLEGYDHILDLEDNEHNDVIAVASERNYDKTLAFLKAIPFFEAKREEMHRAIRAGEEKQVQEIIANTKNGRFIAAGKNSTGRCSLHISVLCQEMEITEFIAQKFPETLKIGDNLERTALHYAMAVDKVETISKILIKCGAKRVVKDLKGRQPTYYFMNKTEVTKLQEEESVLKNRN